MSRTQEKEVNWKDYLIAAMEVEVSHLREELGPDQKANNILVAKVEELKGEMEIASVWKRISTIANSSRKRSLTAQGNFIGRRAVEMSVRTANGEISGGKGSEGPQKESLRRRERGKRWWGTRLCAGTGGEAQMGVCRGGR